MNRGCPNCGCTEYFSIDSDAYDATCYLKILSGLTYIQVQPLVCLNCGTVYVDRGTLHSLKEKVCRNRQG